MTTRRRWLPPLLVGCGMVALAAGFGAIMALGARQPPRPEEPAERIAGLHPDQHPDESRFYVPQTARVSHGTARLTFKVAGRGESSVRDFWRTYELKGAPPRTSDSSYGDRAAGHRREISVVYKKLPSDASRLQREHPVDNRPATITVTAGPT
ncbi:hypothetical protein ACWC2K_38185 [Streptomyces chattanoogensis]